MAKYKITQAGWEGYSGHFGTVEFKDGISVDDVSPVIVQRLAACVSMIEVETGKNPSVTQALIDAQGTSMDADQEMPDRSGVSEARAIHLSEEEFERFTQPELEAIVSAGGLKALREIADPMGIKAKNANALIEALMKSGVTNPAKPVKRRVAGDDATVEDNDGKGEVELAPSVREAMAELAAAAAAPTAPPEKPLPPVPPSESDDITFEEP